MKLSDEKLTGWLVMMAHQARAGTAGGCPKEVAAQFVERGWMKVELCPVQIGARVENIEALILTEAGRARVDLESAEWGCDALEGALA